jgi:legumain
MRSLLLVALIVAVTCRPVFDRWAVLVSGSSGYKNYRHQANICHSYHVLINRGFHPNRIILFTHDDVANHPDNPRPGRLYNRPDRDHHPAVDVNKGCIKDYTGDLVTPTNLIYVITGNSAAMVGKGSGRVLKSDILDHVFIYFTDHGGQHLFAFPHQYLYANQLISAFGTMYKNKMYEKMVVYLEACDSGSMFQGLLDPSWNIYAVSSSKHNQATYATYCPPDDVADGVHIGACLGDEFSVSWMEDSDKMIFGETLLDQFITVHTEVEHSDPSMYGDTGFILDQVGSFIGPSTFKLYPMEEAKSLARSSWNARDSGLVSLLASYVKNPSASTSNILMNAIKAREKARNVFASFTKEFMECSENEVIEAYHAPMNFTCLKAGVDAYQSSCGELDEYSLGYVKYIDNACEAQVPIPKIQSAFKRICSANFIFPSFELESEQVPKSESYNLIESMLAD